MTGRRRYLATQAEQDAAAIESARRTARTIVTDLSAMVVTIVTGSQLLGGRLLDGDAAGRLRAVIDDLEARQSPSWPLLLPAEIAKLREAVDVLDARQDPPDGG